ncbi:MAG TPA: N-acetyl-gamma-glutamyl-phosphate reductase [Candidatus Saccharicenans sp.]|jgi:N-acetyl-gamma-glutamyl-phosphate/LysW-gamma-L-alpha-aminoadipyl-6-phosphate reductase|nr:N-acetyl-gamma-glutamyl-phosphate reductase [Candidatus Saccharicenans sp.]HRD01369.1 N-acetyl-gamma-glutamyl-phosphate reductase [Candidatus Saccharicenans sp.]
MKKDLLEVTIVGGSGYVGGELLRLLLRHPQVRINQVTSRKFAHLEVSLLHPNLRGITDLKFLSPDEVKPCDLIFLALPNGESMPGMEKWLGLSEKIIDLGADFRLKDAAEWQLWYGTEHTRPDLLPTFVYGLPEIYRQEIKSARYVAGPGCEAAVSILCLYPFIKNNIIKNHPIIIDAKMSSSQAGSKASWASHHPERAGAIRSYKPTNHRHQAEIEQALRPFSGDIAVGISATAVEMVRGILVTIHTFLDKEISEKEIRGILKKEYGNEPFVRIIKMNRGLYRYPEPKILQGTNFCDLGFELESRTSRLVIIGAIDNLVKGAAGNAVQCLNLMSGFPEETSLEFTGLHPV